MRKMSRGLQIYKIQQFDWKIIKSKGHGCSIESTFGQNIRHIADLRYTIVNLIHLQGLKAELQEAGFQ